MNLIAQTKYGPVEGFAEGGIRRWFGIPFAAPPVGEKRFRRAQEPEPCSPKCSFKTSRQ